MADLTLLISELNILLTHLSPGQRGRLAMSVGRELRTNQKKRITTQQNPDGSRYTPRKNKRRRHGRIRNKMFNRIKTARYMKLRQVSQGVEIAFASSFINRIASVHHYGKVDKVAPHPRSPSVRYPSRELLGLNEQDIELVRQAVYKHLNL